LERTAGHAIENGSFALKPDGTINTVLWKDYAERAVHEMAVKTKALARAFYGRNARYTYFNGFSTGGREGLKEAQAYPDDFDGILAGAPALNRTKMVTGQLYPQIVVQRELGGVPLAVGQHRLVSSAAISACDLVGGRHLGFVPDPAQCRYDPTADASVLCAGNGGANTSGDCVTPAQARAFNRFWYGQTSDGGVPSPAADNGFGTTLAGNQKWYGLSRGTDLSAVAGPAAFPIATEIVALELQDPTLAVAGFINATGNGADRWRSLTYAQLSNAWDRGVELQEEFGRINTDDPDLSAFNNRGAKIVMYHGLADVLIPPQGSIHYYNRVAAQMGGASAVQSFFRFYLVPGMSHGFWNGSANPSASPPLPDNAQLYAMLTDWVEKGIAPGRMDLTASGSRTSRPICVYPAKAVYVSGDPERAGSYSCS
jgi:feruloyl esterase